MTRAQIDRDEEFLKSQFAPRGDHHPMCASRVSHGRGHAGTFDLTRCDCYAKKDNLALDAIERLVAAARPK